MPRIPDNMLENIAFMYRSEAEARQRVRLGGSAFLVGRELKNAELVFGDSRHITYLVSNRHVVFDGSACVASVNSRSGPPAIWDIDQNDWVAHPSSDLAAVPVQGFADFSMQRIAFVAERNFVTQELVQEAQIGIGDDVFMVGRFVNHQGQSENRPAARFGNVAMMLEDILVQDALGNPHKEQSLAVEMRSRTGFSGSPVQLYRTPMSVFIPGVSDAHMNIIRLLGVNYGYVKDENGDNTFLNGIVPAWKITELLNQPRLLAHQTEMQSRLDAMLRGSPRDTIQESALMPDND